MFGNYIKVAFRNLLRNKIYSLINIGGLAHGLACCLLLVAYIQFEMSFDNFHANSDRIFRLLGKETNDPLADANFTAGHATMLENSIADIESVIRTDFSNSPLLKYGSKKMYGNGFVFADSTFFQAFSFPLVAGDPATALKSPTALVVTETAARRIFGDENPMGRTVLVEGKPFTVTAVARDCPRNSHISFSYVAPFHSQIALYNNDSILINTYNWNYMTYVVLKPGVSAAHVEGQLPAFLEKHLSAGASKEHQWLLQPIRDIHLSRTVEHDRADIVDVRYLYTLGAIGFVILFIACANFMNLSTARSMRRAREVGLRKVLGTVRSHLITQFLAESLLVSLIAFPFAVAFAELMLPIFDAYVGRSLSLLAPLPLFSLAALAVLAGLVGGLYPALYLSHFRPIDVLKGKFQASRQGLMARRALIVAQYSVATVLMIATLVVLRQFQYMQSADPGYQRDHLVQTGLTGDISKSYASFKERLLQNPNILGVTRVAAQPGYAYTVQGFHCPKDDGTVDTVGLSSLIVDEDFIPLMGIELLEGRNFSEGHPTDDTGAYILNEAAVKHLGLTDPVGHSFRVWSSGPGQIVGVVKDFHFRKFHEPIEPMVLRIHRDWYSSLLIRVAGDDIPGTLASIENLYAQYSPEIPFWHRFHDESLAQLYNREERLANMLAYLTGAAILIASLGLFGLASYSAEQRIKELGVRKVLGANTGQLVSLLTRQFTVWVMIAVVVASPIAYVVAGRWLQNFAYRVTVGWEVFAVTILSALAVAVLTVIMQAIRAARMNPARALHYE